MGVQVAIGHRAENLGEAQVVVVSSAIKTGNPEVDAARQRFLPIVRRAEMLGELMRLKWSIAVGGTHGKTTTTSMVATLLDGAGLDPTVINGGIINARSEEHTSELQSLMRISYAVFCLKKKTKTKYQKH